jgi:6-phosphogluconolactonase
MPTSRGACFAIAVCAAPLCLAACFGSSSPSPASTNIHLPDAGFGEDAGCPNTACPRGATLDPVSCSCTTLEAGSSDAPEHDAPGSDGGEEGSAGPTEYAFVTDFSNSVWAFDVNTATGTLTPVAGAPFGAGAQTVFVTVDPSSSHVYVANNLATTVSAYSLAKSTGALTPLAGSPYTAGLSPSWIALSGAFAYVVDNGAGAISIFAVNASTGVLTAAAGSPFMLTAQAVASSLAIDPSGKFAYLAIDNTMGTWAYTIDASTGALSEISGSPFAESATYTPPSAVAVHPGGKFLYATNLTGDTVTGFEIDATSGALSPVAGSPFAAGMNPYALVIDSTGTHAYVANQLSNNVWAYTIDGATGALAPIAGSPFAAGGAPESVAIDPTGSFLYAANEGDGTVSAFGIDSSTGALTPAAGSPFHAGPNPTSIAFAKVTP